MCVWLSNTNYYLCVNHLQWLLFKKSIWYQSKDNLDSLTRGAGIWKIESRSDFLYIWECWFLVYLCMFCLNACAHPPLLAANWRGRTLSVKICSLHRWRGDRRRISIFLVYKKKYLLVFVEGTSCFYTKIYVSERNRSIQIGGCSSILRSRRSIDWWKRWDGICRSIQQGMNRQC
jgi:hypothetical protein